GNDYSPRATYGVTDVTAGPRGAPGGPIPDWDYRANADFMRYASARGGPYPHGGDIVGIIHTHPIGWPRGEYFSGTTTSGDRRVAHDRGWNVYLLDGSNNMRLYDPRTNAPPEYDPARTRGIEVPGAPSAKEIQQLIDCLR